MATSTHPAPLFDHENVFSNHRKRVDFNTGTKSVLFLYSWWPVYSQEKWLSLKGYNTLSSNGTEHKIWDSKFTLTCWKKQIHFFFFRKERCNFDLCLRFDQFLKVWHRSGSKTCRNTYILLKIHQMPNRLFRSLVDQQMTRIYKTVHSLNPVSIHAHNTEAVKNINNKQSWLCGWFTFPFWFSVEVCISVSFCRIFKRTFRL